MAHIKDIKITTLFGLKGGVGKTWMARELLAGMLARGVPTGLLDMTGTCALEDTQRFMEESVEVLCLDWQVLLEMRGEDVREVITRQAQFRECAHVIVDTGRQPETMYEEALVASDVIVLPTSPGMELVHFPATLEAVERAQRAQVALGRAPARVLVLMLWRWNRVRDQQAREALLEEAGLHRIEGAHVSCGEMPWLQCVPMIERKLCIIREMLSMYFGASSDVLQRVDLIIEEVLSLHGESWPLVDPEARRCEHPF